MTASIDDQKRRVAAAFDLAAADYDAALRRCFDLHAIALVREAQVPLGARVLDVAAGTGKVALEAARAVGPSGHVVGVDLSAGMLAQARRKPGDLSVEFRQMDAEALEFPDGAFDVVLCGFGVFFPPDIVRGVQEMRRVLRPGGRVAFSTWASGSFEPMSGMFLTRMDRYGVSRLRAPRTGWMALNDPEHLLVLLEQGGFRNERVVREVTGYFIEPEEWWAFQWPLMRARLSVLAPESLERFKRETLEEVEGLRTEEGLWLDATALIGVGVRE
jgi:ubiquinone/menaquinone biosynthesis C-methylase UbiE